GPSITRSQGPSPLQASVQPTNTDSGEGTASTCTRVPTRWRVVQAWVPPGEFAQVALEGVTVKRPKPPPALVATKSSGCGPRKMAVTRSGPPIDTSQDPMPEH